MASYIASGTSESRGADFTLVDGQGALLSLTAATGSQRIPPGARAVVEYKTSDNVYLPLGELTPNDPAKLLAGPGTFAVTRKACNVAVGVDKS